MRFTSALLVAVALFGIASQVQATTDSELESAIAGKREAGAPRL